MIFYIYIYYFLYDIWYIINQIIVLDRPVTYRYNTLHYYERVLWDRPQLKRKLVSAVLGTAEGSKGWPLSEPYLSYMQQQLDKWTPELDYYVKLIRRIVESILLNPRLI